MQNTFFIYQGELIYDKFGWHYNNSVNPTHIKMQFGGPMYTVAVSRELIAYHYLIGGNWGKENQKHSHTYLIQLQLEGPSLDQHGFLVDIVEIEAQMDKVVERFREQTLNDQVEFTGLNPSVEHFCRVVCQMLSATIQSQQVQALTLRIWENQIAWASFRLER
jgi:6-pyruvoyltetrahydropterin/6-carboxytetrahydropterin synthase